MELRASGIAARLVPGFVGLAVVAGIAFQPGGALALDPGPKCEASKLKTAAKQPKCRANVFAKSIKKVEAPDTVKLAKCDTKFNDKFAKAEEKGGLNCPTTGDAAAIEALLDACIDDVISDLGGAPGAGGDEAKCQSKKAKQAGKYAQCRLKADSKGIKKALPPDYSKCVTKLTDKWGKIEAKPPCATTGDLAAVQADIDACQAAVADALSGASLCGNGVLDGAEECDDGNTVDGDGCSSTCEHEALIEYQQDFESLVQADGAALTNDGWLVFANVFDDDNGNAFLYGYGPFGAPNGGAGFSAIDTGQGGTEQGAQQLSVYSDYNNQDHGAGGPTNPPPPPHLIEANVFQERTIGSADFGRTLTFQFDHKAGNINDPGSPLCPCTSTALAFIKTLDPNSGFATIDFVTVDMTSIPSTWGTSSITLDIDASKDGFILQYGFSNQATLFQPSGIFYDNVVASTLPTAP